MKSIPLLFGLLILGVGAYFVIKSGDAGDPGHAGTGGSKGAGGSTLVARPPAEAASPALIEEADRVVPSPYTPGLTIDTPLIAGGETIPTIELKRHMCLGLGYPYVEFEKFNVIIQQELKARAQAGEDISKYEVTEADTDKFIEKQRVDFAERYPTLDFPTEVGRAYISNELYRAPAAQGLLFDRLFLPDNPREWPEVTRELIRGFGGDPFIIDAEQSYDRRLQRQRNEGLAELPPDDPIIVQTWKDTVLRGLSDFATVETYPGRLGEGVLMSVDGVDVPVATVWAKIEPYATVVDLDRTRRFLVMCKLMEQDLATRGMLMTQEEFEAAWARPEQTYRQTLESYQGVATQMLGQPSIEAFGMYTRILESMRRDQAEALADDEVLKPYIGPCNLITGVAKVSVEAILSSAWDGDNVVWKENGWADARKRSFELMAELEAGADWKGLRELHSEFWDPPLPEIGQKPQYGFRFKGAFGELTRNQLQTMLEESESQSLVYGRTITDRIFYQQQAGTIAGPWMGSRGYYIVRLTGRTPPVRPLDMAQEVHRKLVVDYMLKVQFNARAQELLAQAVDAGSVSGL